MGSRISYIWATIRWLVVMLVAAVGLEAPGVASTAIRPKPLRVWEGIGSWYGPRFHGRLTANGETYDMYAATAAHPTLPLGSLVRVTWPRSGRSRTVRINDRGPFIAGREIDVSFEVARWLGFKENGLARLRLELLEVPPKRWRKTPKSATRGDD